MNESQKRFFVEEDGTLGSQKVEIEIDDNDITISTDEFHCEIMTKGQFKQLITWLKLSGWI